MTITINTRDKNYDVIIGEIGNLSVEGKILIVTNPLVCALHIQKLLSHLSAKEIFICTIKDGEAHKNLANIEEILNNAFNHKLDRKSLIIAFGGGVIGDMAGFAAGIFLRGIEFINIPTTLLAQVDASVGGKTGVNTSFGKNLIGLFHQPKAVHIDAGFLRTLPAREFNAGISEIIKMAVCFDKEFFAWLEGADLRDFRQLEEAIAKSVAIKAKVVSLDEKESGIRAALNYGHTFGHIVELLGHYTQYLHGEAVSIGMCKANNLAVILGNLTSAESARIRALLERYDLPTNYKVEDLEGFYAKFALDKKSLSNTLRFVVPNGIGSFEIVANPPKDSVLEALRG